MSEANDLHDRGYVVITWTRAVTASPVAASTSMTRPTRSPTRERCSTWPQAFRRRARRPGRPTRRRHGRVLRRGARAHTGRGGPPRRRCRVGHHVERPRRRLLPTPRPPSPLPPPRRPVAPPIDVTPDLSSRTGRRTSSARPSAAAARGRAPAPVRGPLRPLDPTICAPLRAGLRDGGRLPAADGPAPRPQPEAEDERRHGTDLPRPGRRRLALRSRPGRRHRLGPRCRRHAVCRALERRGSRRRQHARRPRNSRPRTPGLDH